MGKEIKKFVKTPLNVIRKMKDILIRSKDFQGLADKTMMIENPSNASTETRFSHTTAGVSTIARQLARQVSEHEELGLIEAIKFEEAVELGALAHDVRSLCRRA